jgi:hypothetical protein
MKVLSPTGRLHEAQRTLAPRPLTLDGVRLHTIELNFKNAPAFVDRLLQRLEQDYKLGTVDRHPKIKFTEGYPPEALKEIGKSADVVISAFGH